jgi:hypothetical protein
MLEKPADSPDYLLELIRAFSRHNELNQKRYSDMNEKTTKQFTAHFKTSH